MHARSRRPAFAHSDIHRTGRLSYRNNLERGLKATFTIKPGAPALYLHGEQDGCMDARLIELAPEAFASGSQSETVPGVGHFLQLEDPERVNRLIGDWLGSRAPRT